MPGLTGAGCRLAKCARVWEARPRPERAYFLSGGIFVSGKSPMRMASSARSVK